MGWLWPATSAAVALAIAAGCADIGPSPSVSADSGAPAAPTDARPADAPLPAADAAPPDGAPLVVDAGPPPFPSFAAAQPLDELNSADSEDDPIVTGDLREIYFNRGGDIFRATRQSADVPFSDPQLVEELSSGFSETAPGMTPDGLTFYLASTRPDENAADGQDIYRATRDARTDPWSVPELVPELSSPATDIQAHPNATDTVIVFSSDRGGRAESDLFIAFRDSVAEPWSTPVAIEDLASPAGEGGGPISESGFLCFNSGRTGGGDLYLARALGGSSFSEPQVIEELATSENEQDCWIAPDESVLFFAARRDGDLDLFVAEAQ